MGRIRIKIWIRAVAIALIAFPEPVTTAIGLVILFATLVLFRPKKLSRFGDMEALIKRSLRDTEPSGFRRNLAARKAVIYHSINLYFPLTEQKTAENAAHGSGTKNRDTLSPRRLRPGTMPMKHLEGNHITPFNHLYKAPDGHGKSRMPANSWFDNRKVSETVLHHTLKTSLPQYEAEPGLMAANNSKVAGARNIDLPGEYHKLKLDPAAGSR